MPVSVERCVLVMSEMYTGLHKCDLVELSAVKTSIEQLNSISNSNIRNRAATTAIEREKSGICFA